MVNKYAVQTENKEHSAKSKGNALSVSTKHCIEICSYIRKKNLQKAKELLQLTIEKKKPVPFKRFVGDVGHRKGKLAAGRYPVKACREILKILNSVEANAQFKGLNTSNLIISHICANRASIPWRYGRKIRRKSKRTNVEVVVEESVEKKKAAKKKIAVKKEEKPAEIKKEPEAPKKEPVKEQLKVEKTQETKVSGRRKSEGFSSEPEAKKPEVVEKPKVEEKK